MIEPINPPAEMPSRQTRNRPIPRLLHRQQYYPADRSHPCIVESSYSRLVVVTSNLAQIDAV